MTVHITIAGPQASGKTTTARLIEKQLKRSGANVVLLDEVRPLSELDVRERERRLDACDKAHFIIVVKP